MPFFSSNTQLLSTSFVPFLGSGIAASTGYAIGLGAFPDSGFGAGIRSRCIKVRPPGTVWVCVTQPFSIVSVERASCSPCFLLARLHGGSGALPLLGSSSSTSLSLLSLLLSESPTFPAGEGASPEGGSPPEAGGGGRTLWGGRSIMHTSSPWYDRVKGSSSSSESSSLSSGGLVPVSSCSPISSGNGTSSSL